MNDAAEMVVSCPVCREPRLFVEGEIDISRQVSFFCGSKRCRGHRRYIKKSDLKIIVDKFKQTTIQDTFQLSSELP